MTINEIARSLPTDTQRQKSKQTRLLRFLDNQLPDDSLSLLYSKRMQIEEGFRDLKSLFGFKKLVLKDIEQTRFELLFLLVIMSMGMILILYEKSGYRWSKYIIHRVERNIH